MIRIESVPWQAMVDHARAVYPDECCGAMVGAIEGSVKRVTEAVPLKNSFSGEKTRRYELSPEDLLRADREARSAGSGSDRHFPFPSGLRMPISRRPI